MEKLKGKFELLAEVWDEIYPYSDDLEFWVEIIHDLFPKRQPSEIEILELGSGTGRVTLWLARRGYKVTGVEISKRMREICEKKCKVLPMEIQENVHILTGDFKNSINAKPLLGKYDVVICPFNTYPMFSPTERLKILKFASLSLKNDGYFIIDMWQKDLSQLRKGWNLWDYETKYKFYPFKDEILIWCEYATIHKGKHLEKIEITVSKVKNGEAKTFRVEVYLHLLSKKKTEEEINKFFKIISVYGTYSKEPWSSSSPLLTFICQKSVKK